MNGQAGDKRTLTVTELNTLTKDYLEALPPLRAVSIRGELSNVTLHRTGHIYFTLKDEGAAVSAVIWKSDAARLGFTPENGQKVTADGRVTLWVQRGQYTLGVSAMKRDGEGDLFAAFEELKKKLAAEGLFDQSTKKKLPRFPATIGIITAPTGAAVRDMINITGRRWPAARILLYPTLVQGAGAAQQMIAALDAFNRNALADVIIIGRGGGSTEDLWAFNDEALARAVHASRIPVISAVGHETDFTICDFAADLRAPTPSAAAELAVPDRTEIKRQLHNVITAMTRPLNTRLAAERRVLSALGENRVLADPFAYLQQQSAALADCDDRLCTAAESSVSTRREKLVSLSQRLDALSPLSVLSRGYAAVFGTDGRVIKSSRSILPGGEFEVMFADGGIRAERKAGQS